MVFGYDTPRCLKMLQCMKAKYDRIDKQES